jgi:hypothetical protein
MDARPELLRARCFPLRLERVSAKDISGFMKVMADTGLIEVYVVEGIPYLHVAKWDKHQQQRAKRHKYPPPDGNMQADNINGNQMISDAPVIQSESEKESETESLSEKKNIKEKKYEVKAGVFLTSDEAAKLFDQFGEAGANERIEKLSLYLLSTGKKYKSHYYTILNWERMAKPKVKGNGHNTNSGFRGVPDKYTQGKHGHVVIDPAEFAK